MLQQSVYYRFLLLKNGYRLLKHHLKPDAFFSFYNIQKQDNFILNEFMA